MLRFRLQLLHVLPCKLYINVCDGVTTRHATGRKRDHQRVRLWYVENGMWGSSSLALRIVTHAFIKISLDIAYHPVIPYSLHRAALHRILLNF